jgi:hypothetical protein
MYLNGVDDCKCENLRTELIDPSQTSDAQQFMKVKEAEDKSAVLFDLSNVASVFTAVRNFFG